MQAFIPREQARGFIVSNFIEKYNISISAKYLFGILCDYARNKNYCFPSKKTLAKRMQCSLNSIRNWLKELIAIHVIKISKNEKYDTYYLYIPETNPQETSLTTLNNSANLEHEHANFEPKTNVNKINNLPPSPPNSNQGNSHSQETPTKKNNGGVSYNFDEFWNDYPKKENKEKARNIFSRLLRKKQIPTFDIFKNSLAYFANTAQWQRENGRFIPQLHNFMKDLRWEDVPIVNNSKKEVVQTHVPLESIAERERRMKHEQAEREREKRESAIREKAWEHFSSFFVYDHSFNRFHAIRYFNKLYTQNPEQFEMTERQNITAYQYLVDKNLIPITRG